jgi:hypothetical protein
MTQSKNVEYNVETNEVVETDLTAAQIAEIKKQETALIDLEAEKAAKAAAKAALLSKLGITQDEASLLLS